MRKLVFKVSLVAAIASLSACAVTPNGGIGADPNVFNKENVIPLGGGILGAVVCNKLFKGHGSRQGWTAACGAAGYFASTAFVQQHNRALEDNPVGQTTSWSDPDGKTHSVTPTRTYYQGNVPCREFRQTVEIDGKTEIMQGEACRQADGTWKLMG
ncbi:RT0821/Lpp0805 family surface protein [Arenicella xantha]|uniref:Outer membrane surface antigen n=1 Tax=Arenicella xantha TaxID=644221 RepID=A0A395JIK4_9GAMM|nr:RT0821/Lpp0805 family surface protein [Arenicella xantha]RBP49703.1 outer membrane surface antigen [Arenicella xantha]